MNDEEFRDYWSRKTDSDHVLRSGFCVFKLGAAELQPFVSGRVLELGCGAGELFEHLALDRKAYLGVDFSRSMVETFRARHPGVRVEIGEATSFSVREEFDTILVNNVVQYCAPWMTLACIQNAATMLAKEGRIFLGNIPNRRARVAYHRGDFEGARPSLLRSLRARLFVFFHPTDRIGYWYAPHEIVRWASSVGLGAAIFGCVLYPYRFSAALSSQNRHP